ncbi:MAK10-like protein [Tanacetum coccineum]
MGGSYYSFPCSILSTRKDRKTPQRYPDVPTTSRRISLRSMDSRTINQSADGKLRDRNAEESWALLEDLALYDNESWNDPRDFAKPVKAISLPQDVPMNKITSSYEICSGPHDTQYYMKNHEQAFVEYASSRTDEAGDARLTKFEADFKQQQSEMTNKIDTVLKAITDRIAGALPSDTIKNPKLNVNSIPPVFLPVLEVLSHAPMYNAILDKYVESLELCKNGSAFIQVHMGRLKLLTDFYVIDMKKDPETPLLVGRRFLATANAVIDCKKAKISVGEGITRSVFRVKGIELGQEEAPYWTTLGKRESYKPRLSSDGVGARIPYFARKNS